MIELKCWRIEELSLGTSPESESLKFFDSELNSLKEQEELQTRLEKMERESKQLKREKNNCNEKKKQLEREATEKEIADLQEQVARRPELLKKK